MCPPNSFAGLRAIDSAPRNLLLIVRRLHPFIDIGPNPRLTAVRAELVPLECALAVERVGWRAVAARAVRGPFFQLAPVAAHACLACSRRCLLEVAASEARRVVGIAQDILPQRRQAVVDV